MPPSKYPFERRHLFGDDPIIVPKRAEFNIKNADPRPRVDGHPKVICIKECYGPYLTTRSRYFRIGDCFRFRGTRDAVPDSFRILEEGPADEP